jgi:signal transduction histidine kinase
LVRNLISNGVKYSFDATGFEEAGKFVVKFHARDRHLSVVNYGVPIPENEIKSGKLFISGIRGGTADDRGRVGKGVGLYLVKRVVDLHGGEIRVTSTVQNPGGHQIFAKNEFAITFPQR